MLQTKLYVGINWHGSIKVNGSATVPIRRKRIPICTMKMKAWGFYSAPIKVKRYLTMSPKRLF